MRIVFCLFFTGILLYSFTSCNKDGFITGKDAQLSFSRDTVKFDTVFTNNGNITQSFKLINTNDQSLRLSLVQLEGGNSSAYKINIDGEAVSKKENIILRANDSIYVFVTAFVQPTLANQPFILSDSIRVVFNGNTRFVQLQAYGQNAVYLDGKVLNADTSFSNTKPIVILNSLKVAANVTLSLPAGTKLFAHANAPIIVDGSLKTFGQKNNEVIFTDDRLDEPYRDFPGGWPGIIFTNSSKNNILTYAIIRNAYQAIVVDRPSSNANPKLVLDHSIISNAFDAGLISNNSSVDANNSLVYNCGTNIGIIAGGVYNFTNCTIAGYSSLYLPHLKEGTVVLNYSRTGGTLVSNNCTASFTNCIFWGENGSVNNELVTEKQGTGTLSVLLEHCIYKAETQPANTTFTNSFRNESPQFDTINAGQKIFNFQISNSSAPGINKGKPSSITKDLNNKNRSIGVTDIGCYELQ